MTNTVDGVDGRPRGHVTTDGTFRCDSCCRRRTSRARHPSGFCVDCIARGRSFWLRTLGEDRAVELARELFGPELVLRAA